MLVRNELSSKFIATCIFICTYILSKETVTDNNYKNSDQIPGYKIQSHLLFIRTLKKIFQRFLPNIYSKYKYIYL